MEGREGRRKKGGRKEGREGGRLWTGNRMNSLYPSLTKSLIGPPSPTPQVFLYLNTAVVTGTKGMGHSTCLFLSGSVITQYWGGNLSGSWRDKCYPRRLNWDRKTSRQSGIMGRTWHLKFHQDRCIVWSAGQNAKCTKYPSCWKGLRLLGNTSSVQSHRVACSPTAPRLTEAREKESLHLLLWPYLSLGGAECEEGTQDKDKVMKQSTTVAFLDGEVRAWKDE
jgi:hypothetical protein